MLNFEEARKLLAKRDTKKLARNTYLREEDGNMVVKFWDTDIIAIDSQDVYTLHTGGYLTVTTKDRLNRFSPARIHADKGLWYIYEGRNWDNRKLFAEGVRIDSTGHVVDGAGSEDFPAIMKKVDKLVSKYIADYAAHVMRLGAPEEETTGDCFYCSMAPSDGSKTEWGGYAHYLAHAHENYFVPSILIKAILEVGYNSPGVIWAMMKSDIAQGREPYHLKQALRKFFRTRKPGIAKALADGWIAEDDYDREAEG